MSMIWNLSEAKNRLSEVLDRARTLGPQTIRRRGDTFVLLPAELYEQLSGKKPTFSAFLLNGPRADDLLPMPRTDAPMRDPQL